MNKVKRKLGWVIRGALIGSAAYGIFHFTLSPLSPADSWKDVRMEEKRQYGSHERIELPAGVEVYGITKICIYTAEEKSPCYYLTPESIGFHVQREHINEAVEMPAENKIIETARLAADSKEPEAYFSKGSTNRWGGRVESGKEYVLRIETPSPDGFDNIAYLRYGHVDLMDSLKREGIHPKTGDLCHWFKLIARNGSHDLEALIIHTDGRFVKYHSIIDGGP